MALAERMGFRRKAKCIWDNPEESLGEKLGAFQAGKYTCWKPVGQAREAWNEIRPKVKEYLDNFCRSSSSSVILELYMIGKTESAAVPTILICSPNKSTRKDIRKMVKDNGFLNGYPGMALGDTDQLPDRRKVCRMAGVGDESGSSSSSKLDTVAHAASDGQCGLGRRLFISTNHFKTARIATGGPILWILGELYQLTVGHVLLDPASSENVLLDASSSDEFSFDGDSDEEQSDELSDVDVPSSGSRTSGDICSWDSEDDTPIQASAVPSPESQAPTARTGGQAFVELKDTEHYPIGLARLPQDARGLSLDYALIKLEMLFGPGTEPLSNTATFMFYGVDRNLSVSHIAPISSHDADIVTLTASSGIIAGRLSAAVAYMRLPMHRIFQELYTVHLDKVLHDGDCGAAVVDQTTGELYGHIVAGTPGTGLAYMVPATQLFEHIRQHIGTVELFEKSTGRFEKSLDVNHELEGAEQTQEEPHIHITEFASERYFEKLAKLGNQPQVASPPPKASPLPVLDSAFILPLRESPSKDLKSPKEVSSSKGKHRAFNLRSLVKQFKTKDPESKEGQLHAPSLSGISIGHILLALPYELQIQIIQELPLEDALALRLASRTWYALIMNSRELPRHFFHRSIPNFAKALYPAPQPEGITFHHLCSLWSRLHVASKMASLISSWAEKEIFLRTTTAQELEFSPQFERMRRRLIPRLFVFFHFFENYRQRSLQFILDNGHGLRREAYTVNPIERAIMESYDDVALRKTNEVFPLIVSSFCRRIRPPSYTGRVENSLLGYPGKPSDQVHSAIFCIGGPRQMEKIWKTRGYIVRRRAVDAWFNTLTEEPIPHASSSQPRKGLPGWSERNPLAKKDDSPRHQSHSRASLDSLSASSLAAGPPMGDLHIRDIRLLMDDLPHLHDIWSVTAEALLLERGVVDRPQDIRRNAQVMLDLIGDSGMEEEDEWWYDLTPKTSSQANEDPADRLPPDETQSHPTRSQPAEVGSPPRKRKRPATKILSLRCPTCAVSGKEVWVPPGRVCPNCGTPCD